MVFGRPGPMLFTGIGFICLACSLNANAPAQAQAGSSSASGAPIVVTGQSSTGEGAKPSPWRRAETDNLTVYSDGSDEQLGRITSNLEKLHDLLSRLYQSRGHGQEPPALTVVLFDSPGEMRTVGLQSPRFDEGPFAKPFLAQRYYDPRAEGSILAVPRVDQNIEMNTGKARSADCEDQAASGEDCIGKTFFHPPVRRSWEAVLYGAYAQHLVFNYAPAAYPRWYFDGIGALFSTVVFKQDGSIEYGRPPAEGYKAVFRSYGRLDTAGVLTGEYLHGRSTRMEWTPYHAGLLTHFFVLSNLKAEERAQFVKYMSLIAQGKSMAEAAQAFGSMTELRQHVMSYAERGHEFGQTAKGQSAARPTVTPLSAAAAEGLLAKLTPQP